MLYAQVQGTIYWTCPHCDTMNKALRKTPVKTPRHVLTCANCKALYNYGLTLYKAPPGPRLIPRDSLMIGEGFACKRLVNRIFCEACSQEIHKHVRTDTKPE